MIVSWIVLLWNVFSLAMTLWYQVNPPAETIPELQAPGWAKFSAPIFGLLGLVTGIALVMRRKVALPLLYVMLVGGAVVSAIAYLQMREGYDAFVARTGMSSATFVIAQTTSTAVYYAVFAVLVWLVHRARQKGWIT